MGNYADRNTDNRGKAGYWAARDSERAGLLGEALALYEAMQARYAANWYGYLAKQRLDALRPAGHASRYPIKTDQAVLARAVENLKPVTVAEETAGPEEAARMSKAEQLAAAAWDEAAHAELDRALSAAPTSPRLNLAKAQLLPRAQRQRAGVQRAPPQLPRLLADAARGVDEGRVGCLLPARLLGHHQAGGRARAISTPTPSPASYVRSPSSTRAPSRPPTPTD